MPKRTPLFYTVSPDSDFETPAITGFEADGKNYVEEREGGGF